MNNKYYVLTCFLLASTTFTTLAQHPHPHAKRQAAVDKHTSYLYGTVTTSEGTPADYASVYLKGTPYGCVTDEKGHFRMSIAAGSYTLIISAIGYETKELPLLIEGEDKELHVEIKSQATELGVVDIVSNGVSRVKRSAFNAVALDAKSFEHSTKSLSEALSKTPGMKLRESGGVGSDMQLMMDGFSGKHIKVFIDGVPQEGVGSSFGLNNIPVNFAERIEVYKGVVPVGFGTDAIGGVVNVITKKQRNKWFADASYSYGSFNTHKSYLHFGQTFKNGLTYEVNAFQNYSDNDYYIDTPVEVFNFQPDGSVSTYINNSKKVRVRRFHDTYHNEAIIGKVGIIDKPWADQLMLGFTYSHLYKDIQTGVRQITVYGEKHRKGHSLMPSLTYRKRDIGVKGLDAIVTANYNRNLTTNVDTSYYHYNWYAEKYRMNTPGEQSRQHTRSDNDNWNATLTLNYRLGRAHTITFNHVLNAFHRKNTSLLTTEELADAIPKQTRKHITGLSYRLMPHERWNLSLFAKHYHQYVAGPMAEDETQSSYIRTDRTVSSFGYGMAGTYFLLDGLQSKLSYEKAYRLPTIEEMFGDEDLEMGDLSIRPENSHNVNINLSYNKVFGQHSLYAEAGWVYRYTQDYIQRNITDLSGGKEGATYINYGKVETKGYNFSLRYGFSHWLSVGGNFTQMDVRDKQQTQLGTSTPNLAYGARMPNIPYQFADMDLSLYWRNLFAKGNTLTVTYDNQYLHSFAYYSEVIGNRNNDYTVPNQFSHNVTLSYSIQGRYHLSFECRNLTNEDLYDNFSLQKAGRAFYGKIRVYLGN